MGPLPGTIGPALVCSEAPRHHDAAPALVLALALAGSVIAGTWLFQPGPEINTRNNFEDVDTGGLPELRSRNGLLETTFIAAPMRVHIAGVSFAGAAYNGIYGGPVLRLHAGDLLRLHLINHMADAINLHFHGLRVPPTGRADNMHILVQAGGHFDYEIRIPPSHLPGLFWYHDHAAGAAEPHVTAGLSGALFIDGFTAQFGGLAGVPQKLIVLKDWADPDCPPGELQTKLHCRIVSINGAADWRDQMTPNGIQLWRVSNQGSNLVLHLVAPGLEFRPIGRDGVPANDGVITDTLDIMPASRVDVLVRAPKQGIFSLAAIGVPTGRGASFTIRRTLGQISVAGAAAPPGPPLVLPHMADLRDQPVQAKRVIVFAQNKNATQYTVNGKMFDPARTDLRVPIGTVEEWTIQNVTPDFHEFHIHQLGFQLTEINHIEQNFSGYIDDVRVPEHGEVKLLIPFTDPLILGHVMFHCHVLNHEDRGMMATLEIFQPGLLHICRLPAAGAIK